MKNYNIIIIKKIFLTKFGNMQYFPIRLLSRLHKKQQIKRTKKFEKIFNNFKIWGRSTFQRYINANFICQK